MYIVTGRNRAGVEYVDCCLQQAGIPYVGANMRAKGYEPKHFDEWHWHFGDRTIAQGPTRTRSQHPWPSIW